MSTNKTDIDALIGRLEYLSAVDTAGEMPDAIRDVRAALEEMKRELDIAASTMVQMVARERPGWCLLVNNRPPEETGPVLFADGEETERLVKEYIAKLEGLRLNALANVTNEINRANGWNVMRPVDWNHDAYRVPAVLALIHSEVSEALEAFRKDDRGNFDEELADVIIRTLDCAGGLGVDLEKAVLAKLEKNRGRGFRHGGKRV